MRAAFRLLLGALCALLWLSACVRLVDHGDFICKENADCPSGQKCLSDYSSSRCVASAYCRSRSDCEANEICGSTNRCVVSECTEVNEAPCGDYGCSYDGTCRKSCNNQYDCRGGKVCLDRACVDPPPPGIGETCNDTTGCSSGTCCIGFTRTCQASCACTVDNQCHTDEHCCANATGKGSACQKGSCPLVATGDPCSSDAACLSKHCVSGTCAPVAMEDGSECSTNADCNSKTCCASGQSAKRACTTLAPGKTCPVLLGDYCQASADCLTGYCDGSDNFSNNGFCTIGCPAAGCGYNSLGLANQCVKLYAGSSPASLCKPGCNTEADCLAVYPYLRCFKQRNGQGACDFDTKAWAEPPVF